MNYLWTQEITLCNVSRKEDIVESVAASQSVDHHQGRLYVEFNTYNRLPKGKKIPGYPSQAKCKKKEISQQCPMW